MILVRSPLRITLGGGGTDLPSFAREHGGFCLTAAIDQYVYVSVIRPFEPGIYLKYSELERVQRAQDVKHAIIREVLLLQNVTHQIEITTLADIPAGTGLGSSSSFTTALLKAITYNQHLEPRVLAEMACEIEIDKLQAPIGKQDQYAAAYGGIVALTIQRTGDVCADRVHLSRSTIHALEDGLLLFFTGYARNAGATIKEHTIEGLSEIKKLGLATYRALQDGDLKVFARFMHEHWLFKKQRSGTMSNRYVDRWYDLAVQHGALGGKLVGAGGGGFLLFYTEDPLRLRKGLEGSGLHEVRFRFDFEGTKVLIS